MGASRRDSCHSPAINSSTSLLALTWSKWTVSVRFGITRCRLVHFWHFSDIRDVSCVSKSSDIMEYWPNLKLARSVNRARSDKKRFDKGLDRLDFDRATRKNLHYSSNGLDFVDVLLESWHFSLLLDTSFGSTMKTSKRANHRETEPIRVYCRIKPCLTDPPEEKCVERIDSRTIRLFEPPSEGEVSYDGRSRAKASKDYNFSYVFGDKAQQKDIFDDVAKPLLRDVLRGQNALLFAYGVTSSGKTHTMMGKAGDGLIPRTLSALFASIRPVQAPLCVFKKDPDIGRNGFFIQDERAAERDRLTRSRDFLHNSSNRRQGGKHIIKEIESSCPDMPVDTLLRYSVFVSYIEIYIDKVYDLLQEDTAEPNKPTVIKKLEVLRKGVGGVYFFVGVHEIEVANAEEALALLARGQKVRRIASTKLNAESSRSHTVFNIRLVSAPIQDGVNQEDIFVNVLSLVDLAGSERAKKTENGPDRTKEAAKINNSLMGLRIMMDTLRKKQTNKGGPSREKAVVGDIGFRHTKLGGLFQSFFDDQGTVKMIVCVNPASSQYKELDSVLEFAEGTQEVQTARVEDPGIARARKHDERKKQEKAQEESRQAERAKRKVQELEQNFHSSTYHEEHSSKRRGSDITMTFHGFMLQDHTDTRTLPALVSYLEERIRRHKQIAASLQEQEIEFARRLTRLTEQSTMLKRENVAFRAHLSHRDEQFDELHRKYQSLLEESSMNHQHKIDLGRELQDLIDAHEEERNEWRRKWQEESIRLEDNSNSDRFRDENSLEDTRQKPTTGSRVRTMIQRVNQSSSTVTPSAPTISNSSTLDSSSKYHLRKSTIAKSSTSKKAVNATDSANRQPPPHYNQHYNAGGVQRRSKSKLLMQTSKSRTPMGTILKPSGKALRRSISKVEPKMEDFQRADNYALEHQDADSDGNIRTHIYTGSVIPTAGGGRAVTLTTVETLEQRDA